MRLSPGDHHGMPPRGTSSLFRSLVEMSPGLDQGMRYLQMILLRRHIEMRCTYIGNLVEVSPCAGQGIITSTCLE